MSIDELIKQMKLIKIDNYYIIVSDEDGKTAKPLDINYSEYGVGKLYDNGYVQYEEVSVLLGLIKEYRKVLYSQNPEHNLPSITFSDEVAKKLGIIDVEAKGWDCILNHSKIESEREQLVAITAYYEAYNQALSDNKDKLFTEKEALELAFDAFVAGRRLLKRVSDEDDFKSMFLTSLIDKNIQSLTKQEWEVELEWICSVCNGKNYHKMSCKTPLLRKEEVVITNNSVKVIKIIK